MDRKEWQDKSPKVIKASNIVLENQHLDDHYTQELLDLAEATSTGHLVLLRLNSKMPGLPGFTVRWDQKQETIDVDLEGDRTEQECFEHGQNGYQGHHPEMVCKDPRAFKIDIRLPHIRVYEANLRCNLALAVNVKASMQSMDAKLLNP
ncbi:MAG: hypothetical protein ACRD50_15505 [Candidatus Acidiferrales bacterium]